MWADGIFRTMRTVMLFGVEEWGQYYTTLIVFFRFATIFERLLRTYRCASGSPRGVLEE